MSFKPCLIVLGYSKNNLEPPSESLDKALCVLIAPDKGGQAEVRVRPGWQQLVDPSDRPFIEALLPDLGERAKRDFYALMIQMEELDVGPLVTVAILDENQITDEFDEIVRTFQAL